MASTKLLSEKLGVEGYLIDTHETYVTSMVFSENGNYLASGDEFGCVKITESKTGNPTGSLPKINRPVKALLFIENDDKIVVSYDSGPVRVWKWKKMELEKEYHDFHDTISLLTYSEKNNKLIGAGSSSIYSWALIDDKYADVMSTRGNIPYNLVYSDEDDNLIYFYDDKRVGVWGAISSNLIENKEKREQFCFFTNTRWTCLNMNKNKNIIVGTSNQKAIFNRHLFSVDHTILETNAPIVSCLQIDKNGKRAVLISNWEQGEFPSIEMWNINGNEKILSITDSDVNVFSGIAISFNARFVAYNNRNFELIILDLWRRNENFQANSINNLLTLHTTAKIVMVGASGAGKTSLSHRLCEDQWKLFDSTHGMNITKLDLPDDGAPAGHDREAWLWDLAGQPDYRLIHQLFLDETAAALLVFNPQDPDPFAEVSFWNRVLDRLVDPPPAKLLIASRGDVGGLTISQKRIDDFLKAHGFAGYIPTSAKSGMGRKELIDALAKAIPWDRLPTTSSPVVFKKLKDKLLELREKCETPLLRMDDLRERMIQALPEEPEAGEAIKGVVRIFEHQGVLRRLPFGDFILLKPEIINDYAAVITQNARQHQDEMGCILERDVLEANLNFRDRKRLPNPQDEKLLLAATVQLLIAKALCLKEESDQGTYLVFPSYFRRERDEKPTYPEIHVTYSFTGNVDELYASLVVRLAYSSVFIKDQLWQHAADFKTLTDGQAGVSVTDKGDGKAELVVYFSNDIALDSKITFLKFVHEHFQRRAFIVRDVQRVRTYVCAKCHYIHDLAVVSYRVREGEKELICPRCGVCTSIYDEIEQRFNSDEFEKAVRTMEETAQITIDNQSKEMMLIGQVFDTVGQAGQIFRPTSMFDWGIDGELEFTTPGKDKKGNDISVASGTRLYLQLKSGDSYLRKRKDGTEVFDVSERHADYWQKQRYDVMLIVRNSDGSARWMNITDALKRTKSLPKHIVFIGESFTKESVIQYRKHLLNR